MSGERKESVAVVGAGSWGTAFAVHLAERHPDVSLWAYEAEVCSGMLRSRENRAFLPGVPLPAAVRPTNDLAAAVSGRSVVAFAVRSHHLRGVALRAAPHLSRDACLVSLAKGVENGTLRRMTELLMIDGAGIGSCIVANKVPGVRAGMAYDVSSATNSREHNDTNVLTMGGGLIGVSLAKQIVKVWLTTDFAGDRHTKRVDKIQSVENMYLK